MSSRNSFFLPDGYTSREAPAFFDDAPNLASKVVHQPDVYAFADYLLRVSGRKTVIDIGCGSGRKLLALAAGRRIGLDYRANIQTCRAAFPRETWIEVDLERGSLPPIDDLDASDAVVVCSDVIEHLVNPENLLDMLARLYEQRAIVLVSTPARTRARGADHMGPPGNPAHVREWSLLELERLLESWGLPATFAGYTLNNTRKRRKHTILTIHDLGVNEALRAPAKIRPPLARISGDSHGPTTIVQIAALEREGVDVEIVGPDTAHRAAASETEAGRWVMALEAGEIPGSPWDDLNLRAAFAVIEATGDQAIAFAMLEMARPRASSRTPVVPEPFAFAQPVESYARIRAWRQGPVTGDLPAVARRRWPYALHCRSYRGAGLARAVRQQVGAWFQWEESPHYGTGFHADYLVERLSDVAATRHQFLGRL